MTIQPAVSIVLPVRDGSLTLGNAIQSIIGQTFPDWELLIIDDGSSDDSVEVARATGDSRVRVHLDNKRLGLVARLNEGIDAASGEFIARMDADDIAHPLRLAKQFGVMRRDESLDLIGTGAIVFRTTRGIVGKRTMPATHDDICRNPIGGFYLMHPTFFGRTKWFRRWYYNPTALRAEDQELLLRSFRFSRFANVPELLLAYREDRIDLRKIFPGRLSFARAAGDGKALRRVRIYAEHLGKAAVEAMAVLTGLEYTLLRSRARPLSADERGHWDALITGRGYGQ